MIRYAISVSDHSVPPSMEPAAYTSDARGLAAKVLRGAESAPVDVTAILCDVKSSGDQPIAEFRVVVEPSSREQLVATAASIERASGVRVAVHRLAENVRPLANKGTVSVAPIGRWRGADLHGRFDRTAAIALSIEAPWLPFKGAIDPTRSSPDIIASLGRHFKDLRLRPAAAQRPRLPEARLADIAHASLANIEHITAQAVRLPNGERRRVVELVLSFRTCRSSGRPVRIDVLVGRVKLLARACGWTAPIVDRLEEPSE